MRRILSLFLLAGSLVYGQQIPAAKELTIEAIFSPDGITGREPESIQWSPDGTRLTYILRDESSSRGQLWSVDAAGGEPRVLINEQRLTSLLSSNSKFKDERERERRSRYHVPAYRWAPDSKHLLFDSAGQFWIYSLATQTAVPLTLNPEVSSDPKFSPDGKHVSYLRGHNLFVAGITGKRERQLTRERSPNPNILNGEVDWLYAEELGVRSNYFWSPDSRRIVFLQMDESRVPVHPIEDFIPTHPTVDQQKYPQAGDPNPVVRLGVVKAEGGGVRWIALPDQRVNEEDSPQNPVGAYSDIYVPRLGWVNNDVLYAEVLNRAQDELKLYFIDAGSGRLRLMLDEKSDAWVDINDDFALTKSPTGAGLFTWSSWRDGHTHLYLHSFNAADPLASEARLERQLTNGDWEVTGLAAIVGDTIVFEGNRGDARQRQLYSVRLDGGGLTQISREPGTHSATFGEGPNYMDKFSDLLTPPQLSLCRVGGECRVFWQSHSIADYNLIKPEPLELKAEDGTLLYGQIILPNMPQMARGFPLLVYVYGGPGTQMVRDVWGGNRFLFHQLLAREGIAILQVDNRGSAARGKKFAATLRHNFGEIELKDQLAALDQALEKFPRLDARSLAIWGWSYGGYMTLNALTHSDRFRAGAAGAPVTDWHDYDSTYTERYMGLPQDHEAAYKKSSPVNFAFDLHGALLLAHGTGDDNVHLQNTMQMAQALITAGKHFELALYPRKTHSMLGSEVQNDFYNRMKAHLERTLLGRPAGSSQ